MRLPAAALILLAVPAEAGASCISRPFDAMLDEAGVVADVRALDGPRDGAGPLWSPARVEVLHGDRGARAGEELRITTGAGPGTGISTGPHPRPGDRLRVLGTMRDGVLHTSDCSGTHPIGRLVAPRLDLAGRSIVAARSDLGGASSRPVAEVEVRRARVRVWAGSRLAVLRTVRSDGRVLTRGSSADHRAWSIVVPSGASRLVADTGDAAFTVALLRRPAA